MSEPLYTITKKHLKNKNVEEKITYKENYLHMEASDEIFLKRYIARTLSKIDEVNKYDNLLRGLTDIISRHQEVFSVRLFAVKELAHIFNKQNYNVNTDKYEKSQANSIISD